MSKGINRKPPNRKSWVTHQLRRLSLKWIPRINAMKAGRREYYRTKKDGTPYAKPNFEHQCNKCKKWFPSGEIEMDHVEPIRDPKGVTEETEAEFYGDFIIGLFCYEDNYQKLCKICHLEKSSKENEERHKKKLDNKKKK